MKSLQHPCKLAKRSFKKLQLSAVFMVAEVRYQHNLTLDDEPNSTEELQQLIHKMHNAEVTIQQQSRAKTPQNSFRNDKADEPAP